MALTLMAACGSGAPSALAPDAVVDLQATPEFVEAKAETLDGPESTGAEALVPDARDLRSDDAPCGPTGCDAADGGDLDVSSDAGCQRRNLPVCVGDAVWYADTCGVPWARVELCANGCEGGSCRPCAPTCGARECGPDGCGGSCGPCGPDQACRPDGSCCTRRCQGRTCGPDGCGGSCGTCDGFETCTADGSCLACQPTCGGKACGDDGCGGSCGTCAAGTVCEVTACVVFADADGDGTADAADCRPFDPAAQPGAAESCNGRDDDCDGAVDEAACPGCNATSWGGHAYLFCAQQVAWDEARLACRSMGYRMISVDDAAEQAWLKADAVALFDSSSVVLVWLGLSDSASEGDWVADGGSWSSYRNWANGQGTGGAVENCAALVLLGAPWNYDWADYPCSPSCPFVCELGCGDGADIQPDTDGDGLGDGCDPLPQDAGNDADGDGWEAAVDNCPLAWNPWQDDADGDGVGDACGP